MRTGILSIALTWLMCCPALGQSLEESPLSNGQLPEDFFSASDIPLVCASSCIDVLNEEEQPWCTWKWRGRIDTDAIWSAQDSQSIANYGDLNDVIGLRRARIGIQGEIGPDGRYVAEIDLATGFVVIRDLYIASHHFSDLFEIRAGHFREPFSLEGNTSANSFEFMERSPINTLDPARNWGVASFGHNVAETATFAIGVFQSGAGASDLQGGDGDDTAITARWTMQPYEQGDRFVHMGIAVSSRFPNEGLVLINQQPRSPLLTVGDSSTSPFLPTLRIPADFQQLFNLQLAAQNGPMTWQAEWYGSWIPQIGGSPVFLHGSYVSASYFLQGGHRDYLKQQGVFGSVDVDHPVLRHFSSDPENETRGYGAWELTARMSYLNFADTDLPPATPGVSPGVEYIQATFGVNWYLADRLRILFNYSLAAPSESGVGQSFASIFGTRLGMFW